MRLLILGDSSAAGVGVETQDQALAGQVSGDLARDHTVDWRLVARSGVTVAGVLQMLEEIADARFDAAVICVGVNDVKNGVRQQVWRDSYAELLRVLRVQFGVTQIVVSGVPPMSRFPLLPRPLSGVLGARATAFDEDLQALAARDGAVHLPFSASNQQSQMSSDGFHPGPVIYADWGARVAAILRRP